ncbi:MAG: BA14K family protein [Pararhodobacter sp.]
MKIFFPTLFAAVLTLSPVTVTPASAASPVTMSLAGGPSVTSPLDDLVQVQQRRYHHDRRGAHRHGAHPRDTVRRGAQPRHHRPPVYHHQRRSGPDLGSAVLGAIVGGVIVNQLQQPNQYRAPQAHHGSYLSSNHLNWCRDRWRSYRVSDNSYQPYNGPRRVCVSPFGPT